MKVSEAPNKLYITYKGYGVFDEDSTVERTKDSQTEYTRTDAFIEKVCEWLSDNLQTIRDEKSPSKHHVETIPVLGSITQTEFLERFKKEIIL